MKVYADFFNDKGNVRPAARSEAKNDGYEAVKAALLAAGLEVAVDASGSIYVTLGTANAKPVYFRMDNAVTVTIK